jgi:hypothetical protein
MARHFGMNVAPDGTTLTTSNITSDDGQNATVASAGAGGTLQSSTAQVHAGSTSLRHVGGGTAVGQVRLRFPGTAANASAATFYYYPDPTLTALDIAHIRRSGGQLWRIAFTAAGAVQAKNSSGTQLGVTATGALATGRWNKIVAKWDNSGGTSAGTIDIEVYDGDTGTLTGSLSLTGQNIGTAASLDLEILNPSTSSFAGTHYFDDVLLESNTTSFVGGWIEGSLSATVPEPTFSASGTVTSGTVTGTLAASVPPVAIVSTGSIVVTGSMSATVPEPTVAASGTVTEPGGTVTGSMSATVPKVTSAVAGTVAVRGNLGLLFSDPFCVNESYSEIGTPGGAQVTGTVDANPSGTGFRVVAPASGAAWRSPLRHSKLVPNTTYTVRMLITASSSTTNMTFVHRPSTTVGTTGSVTIGAPPLTAGVPYEYVATFTTSATAVPEGSAGISIVTTVFAFGNTVTIDGVVIRPGTLSAAEMQPYIGAEFPKVASFTSGDVVVTGALSGVLPEVTASLTGDIVPPIAGTLNATVPAVTATVYGNVVSPPTFTFVTPVKKIYTSESNRLYRHVPYSMGTTVLKENGIYRQIGGADIPEDIDNADVAYLGGHEYVISQEEALDLEAAGYGEYINSIGGYGLGLYGVGLYGVPGG